MTDQPDLDTLYAPPAEIIQKAVLDHLVDFHMDYLKVATFSCLATPQINSYYDHSVRHDLY